MAAAKAERSHSRNANREIQSPSLGLKNEAHESLTLRAFRHIYDS